MTKNFDWQEGQNFPGIIINPGTGPIHNTTKEHARSNMDAFVKDVLDDPEFADAHDETTMITIEDAERDDGEGRFTFILRYGDRESEIDMPGLPLEEVRYISRRDQNILDFPRLYENGSSWVWLYAVSQAAHSLFGEEDEDE